MGAALALAAALLAVAMPAAARSDAVTPTRVAYGRPAQISVHGAAGQSVLMPWQPRIETQYTPPHRAYDITAAGQVLLTAGQGGLTLLDAAGTTVSELAHFPIADTCTKVRVRGGTAYVACNATGLWVIDIGDTAAPTRLARIATPVTDFTVSHDALYVLAGHTLTAYDIAQPSKPIPGPPLNIDAPTRAVAAAGATVVVAEGADGVAAYRRGATGGLSLLGRYHTSVPATAVSVHQALAYVALQGRGLVVLDSGGPGAPQWVGSYHRLGQLVAVRAGAGAVYAVNTSGVVYRIDSSRPARLNIASARRLPGRPRDLAVDGAGKLWVLSGDLLSRLDFDGDTPAYSNETFDVGEGVNFGGIRRGVIVGDVLYVADWFSGIHLFDIRDPRRPRLISSFHTAGSPKGIVVRDGYAFVAADDHGLRVIDVHDPRHPRLVGTLATPGLAYTPVLDGQRLYLAGHRGGFQIIDVSDVTHPRLLGGYATAGMAWSLRVRDGIAYVADDALGLEIFDVHDPAHVRRLGGFDPGGDAEDVVLDGDRALVTFFDRGLYVVDIRDPARPRAIAHLHTPGNARGIEVIGDKAYVADWLAGLHVVDIHDLRRPHILGGYDTDGAAWGVRVKGDYAYVMDWWGGLVVLNVSDPRRPRLAAHYHHRGQVHQLAAQGKFLYVAYGRGGLQAFDIKNPLNPIWITGVDGAGRVTGLWRHGSYLYAVSDGGGLTVVDAADPYQMAAVATLDLHLHRPRIVGDGRGYLYIDDPEQGIMVLDATTPARPRRMAMIGTPTAALWATDTRLYVAAGDAIQSYDVTDPGRPRARALLHTDGPVTALGGDGTRLYAAVQGRGISTVADGGGGQLRVTATYPLAGTVTDLAVGDGRVLATQRDGGLWDFTAAPAGTLRATVFYPILHPSTRVAVNGDTAYVAGGGTPTAIAWRPGVTWSRADRGVQDLSLPADTPRGDYEVLRLAAGDAAPVGGFRVDFPPRGGRRFTMEDFEKALRKIRRTQQADTPAAP